MVATRALGFSWRRVRRRAPVLGLFLPPKEVVDQYRNLGGQDMLCQFSEEGAPLSPAVGVPKKKRTGRLT